MKSHVRTWLAVALFVPMAVVLLATLACLPVPVGDPEQAKVDPALTGAWQAVMADPAAKEKAVVTIRPLDARTYFVQYMMLEQKDGKDSVATLNFKGWLTTLGGATFITCETLDDTDFLAAGKESDRFYWVAKIERTGDSLKAMPVDEKSPLLKDAKTREQFEAAIKANVANAALYQKDPMSFKKLDKDHLDLVSELRKKANAGINGN